MTIGIGRREFISALGGATVWPFAACAQAERIRRIGFLATGLESNPLSKDYANAFLHGLDALGWKDGVNLHIDWRWGGKLAPFVDRRQPILCGQRDQLRASLLCNTLTQPKSAGRCGS